MLRDFNFNKDTSTCKNILVCNHILFLIGSMTIAYDRKFLIKKKKKFNL